MPVTNSKIENQMNVFNYSSVRPGKNMQLSYGTESDMSKRFGMVQTFPAPEYLCICDYIDILI